MSEREVQRPGRGSRARLRPLPAPAEVELPQDDVSVPPRLGLVDESGTARAPELDELLRDLDDLRASLRSDLTLAASAASVGEGAMSDWLLGEEERRLREFEVAALGHLQGLDDTPAAAPRRRRNLLMPAAPAAAAVAAVLGILVGVGPIRGADEPNPTASAAALESYQEVTSLAFSGAGPSKLSAAAHELHAQLAPLVATAAMHPAEAEQAIAMLQSERAALLAGGHAGELGAVLAQADALVARLRASLPPAHRARPRVSVVVAVPGERDQPAQQTRTASPSPSRSASPSPSPSRSASPSPSPSSSPSSSAASDPTDPLRPPDALPD